MREKIECKYEPELESVTNLRWKLEVQFGFWTFLRVGVEFILRRPTENQVDVR